LIFIWIWILKFGALRPDLFLVDNSALLVYSKLNSIDCFIQRESFADIYR